MGWETELEAMATIKALGIKGGTKGRGAKCPNSIASPSWQSRNAYLDWHVTIPCQLWTEICLGEVPKLTRGVSTEVCWGRGMVRPCPPCQGLVESVALWDQLFQYSWKVVFRMGWFYLLAPWKFVPSIWKNVLKSLQGCYLLILPTTKARRILCLDSL